MSNRSEAELRRLMRANRLVLRVSRHWLTIILIFLFFYAGLSVAAPVLMKAGYTNAANVLYKIYGPMCHQFAFRSWFLFGEQSFYPREIAGSDLTPFEVYAAREPYFDGIDLNTWSADLQVAAREFRGNEEMGYKVALCERDVAIYATMFLVGLAFAAVRRRLRPVPIWLYVLLGLGPIGLDGFSQLLSYPPFELWPLRETLPGYRVVTGAMFGMMNIWLAFPYLEISMRETIETIEAKLDTARRLTTADD